MRTGLAKLLDKFQQRVYPCPLLKVRVKIARSLTGLNVLKHQGGICDQDNVTSASNSPEDSRSRKAIVFRHRDVEQHHIWYPAIDLIEGADAACRTTHVVTCRVEQRRDSVILGGFIINDEDADRVRRCLIGPGGHSANEV